MNTVSKIDDALKVIAIVAITIWAAEKGYQVGKKNAKHEFDKGYGVGYERGFNEARKEN